VTRVGVAAFTLFCIAACGGPATPPTVVPRGYISASEVGDKWPLSVTEGILGCTVYANLPVATKVVTFKTMEGRTYALNGVAITRGFTRIDPLVKKGPPLAKFTSLARLDESQRRAIFAETVQCEDEADKKSQARYPNPQDFRQQIDFEDKLTKQCKAALQKRHKLTSDEHNSISVEGVSLGWPPMSPAKMDVTPLIERGLKLCDE
jgi:hypothetical protein